MKPTNPQSRPSHIWIIWSASPFWCHPVNVLCRIFNIASLAVHTILRVYNKAGGRLVISYNLVNPCRTIELCWFSIKDEVVFKRNTRICEPEVNRLIFFMVRSSALGLMFCW